MEAVTAMIAAIWSSATTGGGGGGGGTKAADDDDDDDGIAAAGIIPSTSLRFCSRLRRARRIRSACASVSHAPM